MDQTNSKINGKITWKCSGQGNALEKCYYSNLNKFMI